MTTISTLKQRADAELFAGRNDNALALYARMVSLQPANLDARLRVGDALLAAGHVQSAAVVYTALARHAALAGHPLRALIALKILSVLEPRLSLLLNDFASLYCRDSQRIGKSVRRALPSLDQVVDDALLTPIDPSTLVADAERVASNYDTAGLIYPEKLIPLPLFSLLNQDEFGTVLQALQLVRVQPGAVILKQGDPGRSFFVLARGSASVSAELAGEHKHLAVLHEGAIFGEMALLSASPRSATITAQSECDLLEFDCAALATASSTLTNLGAALSGFARERLLRNVVTTSALFTPLDGKQRMDLLQRFVPVNADAGALVINEGDVGGGLYVVLRGEMIVSRRESGEDVEVARLGPGDVFGEISLIQREPTTASVHAGSESSTLLFLSRDYFERLLLAVPELRTYLERLSEERLMDLRLSAATLDPYTDLDPPEEIEVEVPL